MKPKPRPSKGNMSINESNKKNNLRNYLSGVRRQKRRKGRTDGDGGLVININIDLPN